MTARLRHDAPSLAARARSLAAVCAGAFGVCIGGTGGLAAAQPEAGGSAGPLRVVVRVCGARDQQALLRLRGQTSDLPLALVVHEEAGLEPLLAAQLDRARSLAATYGAGAVVWFSGAAESGSLVVYVATPGDGRVFARRLERDVRAMVEGAKSESSSALLEQSALVIRFALKGLTEGGTIGVERSAALAQAERGERSPTPTSTPTPTPTPTPEAAGGASELTVATSDDGGNSGVLWLGLGYEAAIDGFAPEGQHALAARVTWADLGYEAALAASGGVPITRAEPLVTVRLARVRVGASLSRAFALDPRFTLTAGVEAGVLLQLRETIGAEAPAEARPARWNAALQLGPEAALLYRSGRFGVRLGAGLDVLPSPTRFVYRDGEAERESAQPFQVQPRFGLALELAP